MLELPSTSVASLTVYFVNEEGEGCGARAFLPAAGNFLPRGKFA
jgi:hypothetical protein